MRKIPIGVMPKFLHDEIIADKIEANGGMSEQSISQKRVEDLRGAIVRYVSDNRHIDLSWINEYNELLTKLGVKNIEFKL